MSVWVMGCNKCTTVGEVVCVGGQRVYGDSVLPAQFFYDPKIALKINLIN